ncbi:hypothetical protein C5D07_02030, partial [Rathayibacter tritici]|uniref:hypothetical protein n=1 Tax=Rathayibacter tritici TaxID=33888 RepID=UPI000D3F3E41
MPLMTGTDADVFDISGAQEAAHVITTRAATIAQYTPGGAIDVVMPIPDSSRPAAMQVAQKLG